MDIFPSHLSDFYKVSHPDQYPKDTEAIYSNLTARSSRLDGVDHVVFFGLQYFIKKYLINQFNKNFFDLPEEEFERKLAGFKRRIDNSLSGDYNVSRWRSLKQLGYLPLQIKALPEGALVPLRVPLLTIVNTHPEFFWLGQWVETLLSNVLWFPITTATISYEYKKIVNKYIKETSDLSEMADWICHDFSMRGMSSPESSCIGGAGHLLSFYGTDTIPAIGLLEEYYGANSDVEMIGGSISSTEHSCMCVEGKEGEYDIYHRLLTEIYPDGNIGIVSDTYDLWNVLTNYLPKLKNIILSRKGKTVLRPDSGAPEKIICGNPDSSLPAEQKGVIECLWDTFGGTINSKGYKQLHPNIGAIYGDSITLDRCRTICEGLKRKGFACTNTCLGVGSFSYQYNTRDTLGLAFKATSIRRNGQWTAIYKDPITDSGLKKSARGLLMVTIPYIPCDNKNFQLGDYKLTEDVREEMERSSWNCLKTVFKDGELVVDCTLKQIRNRLRG